MYSLYIVNERLPFQAQTGSLRYCFHHCFLSKVSIQMYLQWYLWKSTKICHKAPIFLKATSQSSESQAQMFHIQVWKLFCALCKLPRASVYAEGWCTKCAAHGSHKCFLKAWHLSASIQCERTDTAFCAYKRKKEKRPFQGNNMSVLYPDVYEPGTQVGSVFGYHSVQTESWRAPDTVYHQLINKIIFTVLKNHSLPLKKFILNNFLHVFLGTPKKVRKISHCSLVFPDSRRELISSRKQSRRSWS